MTEKTLPEVRVGQVWADNDKRGTTRRIRIVEIIYWRGPGHQRDGFGVPHAVCEQVYFTGRSHEVLPNGRRTTIRLDRFRPTSNGYRLVQDAEG